MVFVLGIDSGGSKTEALLLGPSGSVLGRGYCDVLVPGSGRGTGGSGRTEASVARAVEDALRGLDASGLRRMHVVGRGRLPANTASEAIVGKTTFHHVREQDGPLALAGTASGVVVLAGTGAFVYGRRPDGHEVFLDALGPLLGDAGGGFDIGLRAVRAVGRASWHPRRRTSLVGPVMESCARYAGAGDRFSLVAYMLGNRDRAEIASLARVVAEHADAGDRVARRVLNEAADAIAETARDALDALGGAWPGCALVAAGSVATKSEVYWSRVCRNLTRRYPGLVPVRPAQPAVVGLIAAALPALEGVDAGFADSLLNVSDGGGT